MVEGLIQVGASLLARAYTAAFPTYQVGPFTFVEAPSSTESVRSERRALVEEACERIKAAGPHYYGLAEEIKYLIATRERLRLIVPMRAYCVPVSESVFRNSHTLACWIIWVGCYFRASSGSGTKDGERGVRQCCFDEMATFTAHFGNSEAWLQYVSQWRAEDPVLSSG